MANKDNVHIKNIKSSKMNIIQHAAKTFYRKYLYVIPSLIINIFISNCNLIIYSVSVTVTDYKYIYFVVKLCSFSTCN